MTKKFEFNWRIDTPEIFRTGATFDRWFEDKENTEYEPNCLFKVDDYGFFIYWKSDGKDGDVIELAQVSDIRYGGTPVNPKLSNKLSKHGTTEQLDEKSLTICSGTDYTNIHYQHIVCTSAEQAKYLPYPSRPDHCENHHVFTVVFTMVVLCKKFTKYFVGRTTQTTVPRY